VLVGEQHLRLALAETSPTGDTHLGLQLEEVIEVVLRR